jgi:hypothetical protein
MFEAVVVVPLFLALLGLYLLLDDRKENGGMFVFQRSALLANGARASGTVLDHADHSPGWAGRVQVHTVDLVVEFTPEGASALRVPLSYRLADGAMSDLTEKGRSLPLRYDARKPTRALIDWGAILGGPPRDPSDEQRKADKARQAALLRGEKS